MATDEELSRYLCEHYAYELSMLRFCHCRLSFTASQMRWNAYWESSAVHARVLRDFYASNSKFGDDRIASEYGVRSILAPPEIDKEFGLINKQIAHLDKNRPFGAADGKLTRGRMDKVVEWVESAHKIFLSGCRPERKQGWTDSLAIPFGWQP